MTRTAAGETAVSTPAGGATREGEAGLLRRLRDGQDDAFGELYELHVGAVRRLARSLSTNRSEADDLTAETFFRVLQAMRRGAGPRESARAYLLTVARRVFWEWQDARREVPIPDDELTVRAGPAHDRHGSVTEHALITRAFAGLPERWRVVLWQTEVEGVRPAVVGPHFGLSANATAALARRARQGLRAAYLQAHVATEQSPQGCRAVLEKLGGYTAGAVTGAQARKVRAHLRTCPHCRATHGQLRDVCSALRAHAGALAVFVPATGFVLAGASGATGSTAGTMVAAAFGTKLKVGLAVASTTAAGALVATPVVIEPDPNRHIGLRGPGAVLRLTSTTHPVERPPVPSRSGSATARGLPTRTDGVIALSPVQPSRGDLASTSAPSEAPEQPPSGQPPSGQSRRRGTPHRTASERSRPARQGRIALPDAAGQTEQPAASTTSVRTNAPTTSVTVWSTAGTSSAPPSTPGESAPTSSPPTTYTTTTPASVTVARSRPPDVRGTAQPPTAVPGGSSARPSRGVW